MFIPPGREDWKQFYSKYTINRNQDKWFYQMSENLWDAQSALHEVVWTILMSAPSKSFTTCCNLKSKEFDFCNEEERDSTTRIISERNIFLAKCGDLVTLQYVLRVMERIGAKCPDPGFQDSTCWSVFFVMNFSMSSLSNSYSFLAPSGALIAIPTY